MILNTSTFLSPTYTLSLAGNKIVYTFSQGTTREKYFVYIIYKEKKPTQAGKKTFSLIPSLIGRVFPISRQKMHGPNPSEMDIKVLIAAYSRAYLHNKY